MKKLLEKCFKIYVVVKYGINRYCWEGIIDMRDMLFVNIM